MNPGVPDEHLVTVAQSGDREAFLTLYNRYLKRVYNRVKSRVPVQDAEDVTQDIFIAVVRSLDSFQQRSTFSTWLYTIVNRHIADYYRKYYRKGDHKISSLEAVDSLNIEAKTSSSDTGVMLQQALEMLPQDYQEVILMRFADGLKFAEIADELGESLEAIKSRYRRAIQALRDQTNRI